MAVIDLSHAIADGQTVYPHLPPARIHDQISREDSASTYAEGTSFQTGCAQLVGNLGSWVDAPFHRFAAGSDVSELALDRLAHVRATVVRIGRDVQRIDAEVLDGLELGGRAVLFDTGWARRWQQPSYGAGFPFLATATARRLVDGGATFVGIDSLNVDDPHDLVRPVHTALLGAGIPIGENLTNLCALPDAPAYFHAAPVKLVGMGSFPVRAYAVVDD